MKPPARARLAQTTVERSLSVGPCSRRQRGRSKRTLDWHRSEQRQDRSHLQRNRSDVAFIKTAMRMKHFNALNLESIRGRPVITMVANFEYRVKDHPMLLRAAQRVKPEVPEAVFVIAGEGELRAETEKLAEELGLTESCLFIGRCASVPDLLAASDICVLSSQAEGFSNSILEYMAAGRVRSWRRMSEARVKRSSKEKRVTWSTPETIVAMAERLISLLRDPEKRRTMGLNGRRRVEQRFSTENRLMQHSVV